MRIFGVMVSTLAPQVKRPGSSPGLGPIIFCSLTYIHNKDSYVHLWTYNVLGNNVCFVKPLLFQFKALIFLLNFDTNSVTPNLDFGWPEFGKPVLNCAKNIILHKT